MSDINTELLDGVLRVELDRPEAKNAMTGAMYNRLAEILNDADKDDAIRAVLWHGAGEGQEFAARVVSAEAKEAFAAFLEKRPPNFAKAA